MATSASVVIKSAPLGFPFATADPFLFAVYHNDFYPAGNAKMEAPRRGNGADFDWNAPYRMYHGDRVPGFPAHPHRGFETLTVTLEGLTDHADSYGNSGRYGGGDLQWLTAGEKNWLLTTANVGSAEFVFDAAEQHSSASAPPLSLSLNGTLERA